METQAFKGFEGFKGLKGFKAFKAWLKTCHAAVSKAYIEAVCRACVAARDLSTAAAEAFKVFRVSI